MQPQTCPNCRSVQREGARYCHRCGKALPPAGRQRRSRPLRLFFLLLLVLAIFAWFRASPRPHRDPEAAIEVETPRPLYEVSTFKAPVNQWSRPVPVPANTRCEVRVNGQVMYRTHPSDTTHYMSSGTRTFQGPLTGLEFQSVQWHPVDVSVTLQR